MNRIHILGAGVALVLLACAPGCARDTAPSPTPSQTAGVVEAKSATFVQGDVAPKQLYKVPVTRDLGAGVITTSLPTSPKVPVGLPAKPEPRVFRSTLVIVPPGSSAGEKSIPIDESSGAEVYVGSKANDPAVQAPAAKDVQFLAPDHKTRLDVAAPKLGMMMPSKAGTLAPPSKPDASPMSSFTIDPKFASRGDYVFKYGTVAAKAGVAVEVRMPSSPIAMEVTPSAGTFLLGDSAVVSVKLTNGDAPVTGAKLECDLVRPDGSKGATVAWREVGSGVYEALISNALGLSDAVGAYNINVHATGATDAGVKFDRFGTTAFGFAVPTAQIVSAGMPRTVADPSGAIAAFEADVNLEAASNDRYEVSATLVAQMPDGTERPVAEAQTTATLGEGKHTLTLHFDAGYVALTKLEGAFVLRNLRLYSLGQNSLYHRLGKGLDLRFPAVRTLDLLPLKEITPAVDQMIQDGEFDLTAKP